MPSSNVPPMSRRAFSRSLCGAPFFALPAGGARTAAGPWDEPAQVAKVYLTGPTIHLPCTTVDVRSEVAELDRLLEELSRRHPEVRFTGGRILTRADEIEPWAKTLADADALLIVPVTAPGLAAAPVLAAANLPALCFCRHHASHMWSGIARLRDARHKVDVVAAHSVDALAPWTAIFRTIRHMRRSKVLVVAPNRTGS